jgi:hypothetical protein
MPRGSKPGERRGGRQRGTPNKKTTLKNAAIAAVASNPDISPLDFLLGVMRDPNVSPELRIKVAQAAAPFAHAKPGRADPGDPTGLVKLIDGTSGFTIDPAVAKALRDDEERLNELVRKQCAPREYGGPPSAAEVEAESELRASIADRAKAIGCPVSYGPRQARNDSNRLHQIQNKRRSPSTCGGGKLTAAEDAEEAQLVARIAAFEESPEGRARSRILELELQGRDGRATAEQDELDSLRTLYPDLPDDPDDPLYDSLKAFTNDG